MAGQDPVSLPVPVTPVEQPGTMWNDMISVKIITRLNYFLFTSAMEVNVYDCEWLKEAL